MNGRPVLPSLLLTALLLPAAEVRAVEQVDLRVLRAPGALELVLDGMGPRPEIQKRATPEGWTFEVVTDRSGLLSGGARFLNLQEAGIDTVGLDGGDRSWRLQVNGRGMGAPLVTADGTSVRLRFAAQPVPRLTSGSYDLTTPGRVPQEPFVPPLRRRAVAPPGGDMAISTMVIRNRSYLNISGPPVTMTTRGAQARDVLMLLARAGRYGFVFEEAGVDQSSQNKPSDSSNKGDNKNTPAASQAGLQQGPLVTVSFRREPLATAFNLILMNTGLQARLQGRSIVVGYNALSKTLGAEMSKTYRLNQVDPVAAADYLASLGARIQKIIMKTVSESQGASAGSAGSSGNAKVSDSGASESQNSAAKSDSFARSSTATEPVITAYGGGEGPLKGLAGTIDPRLRSITVLGDAQLVSLAESYLRQIDLRQRQVSINVKILNIDLNNDTSIANSFAFRSPNAFIVNQNGQLVANFGQLRPPTTGKAGLPGGYSGGDGESPIVGAGAFSLPGGSQSFIDRPVQQTPLAGLPTRYPYESENPDFYSRPGFGPYSNPGQPGVTSFTPGRPEVIIDPATGARRVFNAPDTYTREVPKNFQYPVNQLFDYVSAQIVSRNAKTLASPTLVVQEGESAEVKSVESVITNITTTSSVNGTTSSSTTRDEAGISLGLKVDKIDDNGFITVGILPDASIATPAGTLSVGGQNVVIYNITKRLLKSSRIRIRDGQTLVLTGVITDRDVASVTKWPLLGDIPFFGQFFRSTGVNRTKQELVIVVTPRILDDEQGGGYGYGYEPSSQDARQMIYQR